MFIAGFLIYSAIFIYLLYRLTRKAAPLSFTELAAAFMFKVLMGCLYGYVYLHFYNGDDTWMYHHQSLEEYEKLLHNTSLFFTEIGPAPSFAWAGGGFWHGLNVYFKTLENDGITKTLGVVNILSRGNYYINVVFFNFILFWGSYWLFKILVKEFPAKRGPLLLMIFFFPPLVFWLSGIRADGLLLFFLSLLLIHFRRWIYEHKRTAILYCIVAIAGLLIFRMQLLMVVIPALLAWYISVKFTRKPVLTYSLVFAVTGLVFFATAWISPGKNLPGMVAKKQQEFFVLQGTRFQLDSLQPSVTSYVRVLPQAVSHTFFRPWIWEAKGVLQIMTALEVIVFWLLVIWMVIKRDDKWKAQITNPLLLFFLSFGITLYIFIGYTIPFPGAIVRYKAVPELLLLIIPIVCSKWRFFEKINKKLYI
jgi:hypothetical protein